MKIWKDEKGHWVIDFTCRGRRITQVIGPSKREAGARAAVPARDGKPARNEANKESPLRGET